MKKCQIIVSEGIEQINDLNGNSLNKLIQPVLTFRVPFVPSTLTFHIMVITTGYDYSKPLIIGFRVYQKDTGLAIQEQKPVEILPGNPKFSNFNLNIDARNVPIMQQGEYIVEITIEDDIFDHSFNISAEKILKVETT